MVAQQEVFNSSVNLLVAAKMGNFHHFEHNGLRQLLNPRMGDNARIITNCLPQVFVVH
jgi:hypothetical protein